MIELLVVIAIIALLAAVLFPVFARAREKARQTTCVSNLRQMGLALAQYIQDSDGAYPNGCSAPAGVGTGISLCTATGDPYLWMGRHFRWLLMPYLGFTQQRNLSSAASGYPWIAVQGTTPSILVCPSDASAAGFDSTSYGYSACFYHADAVTDQLTLGNLRTVSGNPGPGAGALCQTRTEAEVVYPAQKMLVGEFSDSHLTGPTGAVGYWGKAPAPDTPGPGMGEGMRNYVFADGHVRFVAAAAQRLSTLQSCPDMHRTPGGLAGRDLP